MKSKAAAQVKCEKEYAERAVEMRQLLKKLDAKLAKHAKEQKAQPWHWGYVGDLGGWVEKIREIVEPEE